MSDDLFKLRITAYTPETIPMNRLAAYMHELAALMGHANHVHFKGLRTGSTVLCARVEHEDVPKVSERLREISNPNAPSDIARAYASINTLLRGDNARATLRCGSAQIIKFPGCDVPVLPRVGPVKEVGQLEGMVISVGGKDSTKHIRLVAHDGEEFKLTTRSVELAKQLGGYLFGLVRVDGVGTWYRNENGRWELDAFIVQSCEPLEDRSLVEAVAALRAVGGGEWTAIDDPLAVLADLRRD